MLGYQFKMGYYPSIKSTMNELSPETQYRALGEFLRSRREGLAPETVGLAAGQRRRTPGLRREEVARLCGISATWYTWIEQGRAVSVSPSALARLARGLLFSRAERAYLFELAGKFDPDWNRDPHVEIPGAVLDCVDAIGGPAYILDRYWTARRWNAAAAGLFVGWLDGDREPNLLRFVFLEPSARRLISDWEERARRVAAEFRAATTSHVDDPDLHRLIDDLHRESPEFARFWDAHGVLEREGGTRSFNHPDRGTLRFRQISLTIASWPDFRLTMLLPEPAT